MRLEAASVLIKDVTKRFGHVLAVDRVSLQIEPGELLTLLGPSGCGKTTILRIVAGLETATDGRVFIGEADVTHLPPNARDVTMMFQSYALFPHLSVFENVAYGLRVLKSPEAEIGRAVRGHGARRDDRDGGPQPERPLRRPAAASRPGKIPGTESEGAAIR